MARRVRPLLRLQNHVAGQVFLKGSEAILQRGFLQVSNRSYQLLHFAFSFFSLSLFLEIEKKIRKNYRLFEFAEFGQE